MRFSFRINLKIMTLAVVLIPLTALCASPNWNNAAGDNLWSTGGNWSNSLVPQAGDDPGVIRRDDDFCLISDGMEANCNTLRVGVYNNPLSELQISGGSLETASDIWIGRWGGCGGSFIEMDGGELTIGGSLRVSYYSDNCFLKLNGGSVFVGGELTIDESSGQGGFVDISAGTLCLAGDKLAQIKALVSSGKITAYQGQGSVDIFYDGDNTYVTASIVYSACQPSPADGQGDVRTDIPFDWTAGAGAISHHLYLAENFEQIENADQTSEYLVYSGVEPRFSIILDVGRQYYWRVDEIDADGNVVKGDIWLFTTINCENMPRTSNWNNLSGDRNWSNPLNWSDSQIPDQCCDAAVIKGGANRCVINSDVSVSRLRVGVNGNLNSELELQSGSLEVLGDAVLGVWAGCEGSRITVSGGHLNVYGNLEIGRQSTDCSVSIQAGEVYINGAVILSEGSFIDIQAGMLILEGEDASVLEVIIGEDKMVGYGGNGRVCYFTSGGKTTVWAEDFTGSAFLPQPADKAIGTNHTIALSWQKSSSAIYHYVYFGTDADAVKYADRNSPEYLGRKVLNDTVYSVNGLKSSQIYYWRVDENDGYETVKGPVWSFTVAEDYGISYWAGLFDHWLAQNCTDTFWSCLGWDMNMDGSVDMLDFSFVDINASSVQNEYYVAPYGSDESSGTFHKPFRTIQRAAGVMQAGDTCFIRGGIYRETVRPFGSGLESLPIVFRPYGQEKVVVSGLDLLDSQWTYQHDDIYNTRISERIEQLFVDGTMYNEARWPNCPPEQMLYMPRAATGEGTGTQYLSDENLPEGDWSGAYVHIIPGKEYVSYTKRIKNYVPGSGFEFVDTQWASENQQPQQGDPYYLFGSILALDSEGEWYNNYDAGELYIKCIDSGHPGSHCIEYKKRLYAFDLSERDHIQISGINIVGAAIDLNDADFCVIDNCRLEFVEHYRLTNGYEAPQGSRCNVMGGSYNEWKNSSIVYSAGCGIYDTGSWNRITNCIIMNVNYSASSMAAVNSASVIGGKYEYNTFSNSGRSIILHGNSPQLRIMYNDLSNAGLLTKDCGITYTWFASGADARIAYNYIHGNNAELGMGVYLDYGCSGFNVDHNLFWDINWSAVHTNFVSPSQNNEIHNNTIMASCGYAFRGSGQSFDQSGSRFYNNCIENAQPLTEMYFVSEGVTSLCPPYPFGLGSPSVLTTGYYDVVSESHNINFGELAASSPAIDAGVVIEGVTDGYAGSKPDIGCFENSLPRWRAGADWQLNE